MEVYWEINSTEIHNYQTWHLNAPVPCYMLIIESQSHWRTKNKTNIWVYLGILVTFSCKASRCDIISSLRVSCIAEPNFWISLYCMVNDEHIKEFKIQFFKIIKLEYCWVLKEYQCLNILPLKHSIFSTIHLWGYIKT